MAWQGTRQSFARVLLILVLVAGLAVLVKYF